MVRAASPGRRWGRAERRFRQAAALLARDPAAHAALDDPDGVAYLLDRLREAGAHEQAAALVLAARAAAHAPSTTRPAWPASWTACGRRARVSSCRRLACTGSSSVPADQFRFGREADGTPAAPWAGKTWICGLFPGRGDRRHRHSTEQGTHVGSASQMTSPRIQRSPRRAQRGDRRNRNLNPDTSSPGFQTNLASPSTMVSFLATFSWTGHVIAEEARDRIKDGTYRIVGQGRVSELAERRRR